MGMKELFRVGLGFSKKEYLGKERDTMSISSLV